MPLLLQFLQRHILDKGGVLWIIAGGRLRQIGVEVADRAGFEPTSPALMAAYLSELGRAARAALSSGRPCDGEALLRLVARIGGDGA